MNKIYAFTGLILILLASPVGPLQAEPVKKLDTILIQDFEAEGRIFAENSIGYFQVIDIPISPGSRGSQIGVEALVSHLSPEGCAPCHLSAEYEFFAVFNFYGTGGRVQAVTAFWDDFDSISCLIKDVTIGVFPSCFQKQRNRDSRRRSSEIVEGEKKIILETMPGKSKFNSSNRIILNWSETVPLDARYLQLLIGVKESPPNDTRVRPPLALSSVQIQY